MLLKHASWHQPDFVIVSLIIPVNFTMLLRDTIHLTQALGRDVIVVVIIMCAVFAVALLALAWSLVLLTAILMYVGYDIIPVVFEDLPLDIRDNKFYLRGLSWQMRMENKIIYEVGAREQKVFNPIIIWAKHRLMTRTRMTIQ